MADRTPTVEQAREILYRMLIRLPEHDWDSIDPAIDALIAAVRAELLPYTHHTDQCATRTKCRYCDRPRYEHGHSHSFEADREAPCTCGLG